MAKKNDQEMTVVAELEVTSPLGKETVRSFDKAWRRLMELPVPVRSHLIGFVRKNDEELVKK